MNRALSLGLYACKTLDRPAAFLVHPFLLGVRLYWGWQFCQTGWGKLMNLEKTKAFFTELGLPLPGFQAGLAGATECFGGLLLLIGLFARPVAIPLIITMLVAYFAADREAVMNIFSDPDTFTAAAPFLFLLAAVIVFIFGPGWISVDGLAKYIARRRTARSLDTDPGVPAISP